ncbi:MOSC domain-containing protein [Domibacillus iocasae]|uniref:Cytoplasmic protein n=1 Tax=Domibacillus iocasae TaxID=1714016 RepID=A0A1E7DRE7_9BACI|nr:MOSC domain-containing protein [Domibacillus iocasae]OES45666.1 cytoplasmic protein [Domibacillus iocasae]
MKLVSLNIGKPAELSYKKKTVLSGIKKRPVQTSLYLSNIGFIGDGQADLIHHGGEDKAVCVYALEHYAYWEETFNRPLPPAAFGENVTAAGVLETDVHVGDVFQLGESIVQISQPRQPCFKLAALHHEPKLALLVEETGYTGFYFRVLTEGKVKITSELKRTEIHPAKITISKANTIMNNKNADREDVHMLSQLEELAESWKKPLRIRLQ